MRKTRSTQGSPCGGCTLMEDRKPSPKDNSQAGSVITEEGRDLSIPKVGGIIKKSEGNASVS